MITAIFSNNGKYCSGFEVSGHSGLDDAGKDILCAAVSGAVELAANVINGETTVDSNSATVSVLIPCPDKNSEFIITALKNQLSGYSDEYPEYIRIVEQECK